jgi:hypothetical protein
MRIAQQKRKENIAEYILYLYQIEDLIRAFGLDMAKIDEFLVHNYRADKEETKKISEWYRNLALMMQKEGKQQKGHLQFLANLLNELGEFHLRLMHNETDPMYVQIYQAVAGLLNELRQKNPSASGDVEVAIDGVYGYLLLKIQKKEITEETKEAMTRVSQWLAYLSKLYKDYESGDLEM